MSNEPAVAVRQGSRVRIRDANGQENTVTIRDDTAPTYTSIHSDSPLGKALMGRRVGDQVAVRIARSLPERTVTILAID